MGAELDLVAINHWPTAIDTHQKNFPLAKHYCINLDAARPEDIVEGGHLDLLLASPECTFFSRARGGKPVNDQRRASAYHVQRWITALNGSVDRILCENVKEWLEWGPLLPNNKPDPAQKGIFFFAWVNSIVSMGYDWDWRLLNAADYGDATTRERLFVQFVKKGLGGPRWPAQTHGKVSKRNLGALGSTLKRRRAAEEVIDWTDTGRSLLDDPKYKKRPLSIKTRMRIARGLVKFGGPLAPIYIELLDIDPSTVTVTKGRGKKPQPFLLSQQGGGEARSSDEPVPTITTAGYVTMVSPFLIGQHTNNVPQDASVEPVPTVTTVSRIRLIEPLLSPYYSGTQTAVSVNEPLPTITTKERLALVDSMAVPYGPKAEAKSVDDPLPTIMTRDRLGVATTTVEPFVLRNNTHAEAKCMDEPLPTATTATGGGMFVVDPQVQPFIVSRQGHNDPTGRVRPVTQPLSTITGSGSGTGYLVEPFIVPQFGEREGQNPRVHDVSDPLPVVTSHGAGGLVQPLLIQTDQTGGSGLYSRPTNEPLPTVVTKQTMAIVQPFIVQGAQTHQAGPGVRSTEDPLYTLTTGARLGLTDVVLEPLLDAVNRGDLDPRRVVLIDGVPHKLDIRFRMLKNRELARATGFDDEETEYEFTGTQTEITKQIGNAVCVNLAASLVSALLAPAMQTELAVA